MSGDAAAETCADRLTCGLHVIPLPAGGGCDVQLSFCSCVYPCLVITYMGQASFLMAHPEAYTNPFWLSTPSGSHHENVQVLS
jgi:hypothetical protein